MPIKGLMLKQASLKDRILHGYRFKVIGKILCLLRIHCWEYNCDGYDSEWEECFRGNCGAVRELKY